MNQWGVGNTGDIFKGPTASNKMPHYICACVILKSEEPFIFNVEWFRIVSNDYS